MRVIVAMLFVCSMSFPGTPSAQQKENNVSPDKRTLLFSDINDGSEDYQGLGLDYRQDEDHESSNNTQDLMAKFRLNKSRPLSYSEQGDFMARALHAVGGRGIILPLGELGASGQKQD